MKTKEQLLEKQAQELAKFEKEQAVLALLPEPLREDAIVCIHRDHASVKVWSDFRTERKLADAIDVLRLFADVLQTCEHWKDGCVSTNPPQINDYAKKESAVMDGSHVVEIKVSGGKGYGPTVEVRFWADTSAGLVEFGCPVSDLWKLIPRVHVSYNRSGEVSKCEITWPTESRCVDSFRTWWADKPSYSGSYYLADLPNFYSWAGAINATVAVTA